MFRNRPVNKRRVAVSILLMLTGALLVIGTSLNAILRSSAQMYEDVASFTIDGNDGKHAFQWEDKERLSLWLALPDRSVEGKNFIVQVTVNDGAGEILARFQQDFRTVTLRSQAGELFYYRLGSYKFFDKFDGGIAYHLGGEWLPDTPARLVLRRNRGTQFTTNDVILVIVGGLVLMLGLGALFRATP